MNERLPFSAVLKSQAVNRRDLLQRSVAGAAGLWLADSLDLVRGAEATPPAAESTSPAAAEAKKPLPVAKAEAVIQIWLWGGPSHLDTFDPKPEAGSDYSGPLVSPIQTSVPGMRICELLPQLAKLADKFSIIRTMTHGQFGHETAAYMTQTGRMPGGRLVYPTVGAVVTALQRRA